MAAIDLIRVTEGDAVVLADLKARTFEETFSADNDPAELKAHLARAFSVEAVRAELAHPGSRTVWLREEGKHPVGYLKVNTAEAHTESGLEPGLEVQQIYVLGRFHGRGLGGRLLRHALELARHERSPFVWLSVWERNQKAIAIYEHHGFVVIGEHIFLMGDDPQRDLLMRLDLHDG